MEQTGADVPAITKTRAIGATVFATGNLINFASFGFAAQSLVSAVSTLQMVYNVVFAHVILGLRVTCWTLLCTAVIIVGNVLSCVSLSAAALIQCA